MYGKLMTAMVLALATTASAASAQQGDEGLGLNIPGEFSANVGLTNDYRFRGISQTDEDMALQGGFDYSHPSGLYLGVWGSNVEFNDDDEAQLELDLYGGFSGEYSGFLWDVGALYYAYPGADSSLDYNYWELTGSLGYDFQVASVSAGLAWSPEFFADSGDAWYYNAGISIPVMRYLSLDGSIGRQEIDDNSAFGADDYTDWAAGVSTEIEGFGVAVQYVDTNLSNNNCFSGTQSCGAAAVVSVSREF